VSSLAALAWQNQVYRKISHKLRLQSLEHEEIQLLKVKAETLRDMRKRFVNEEFD